MQTLNMKTGLLRVKSTPALIVCAVRRTVGKPGTQTRPTDAVLCSPRVQGRVTRDPVLSARQTFTASIYITIHIF